MRTILTGLGGGLAGSESEEEDDDSAGGSEVVLVAGPGSPCGRASMVSFSAAVVAEVVGRRKDVLDVMMLRSLGGAGEVEGRATAMSVQRGPVGGAGGAMLGGGKGAPRATLEVVGKTL